MKKDAVQALNEAVRDVEAAIIKDVAAKVAPVVHECVKRQEEHYQKVALVFQAYVERQKRWAEVVGTPLAPFFHSTNVSRG